MITLIKSATTFASSAGICFPNKTDVNCTFPSVIVPCMQLKLVMHLQVEMTVPGPAAKTCISHWAISLLLTSYPRTLSIRLPGLALPPQTRQLVRHLLASVHILVTRPQIHQHSQNPVLQRCHRHDLDVSVFTTDCSVTFAFSCSNGRLNNTVLAGKFTRMRSSAAVSSSRCL